MGLVMQGVFLHILADTLGSVGVIISAILMQLFGWMIADPVCSIFIALLIALSVGSLIADSVAILMQRSPKALDHSLPEACQKVMQLEGVQAVQETHFWTLCSNYYCGGLKLEVAATADHKYIVSHTQGYQQQQGYQGYQQPGAHGHAHEDQSGHGHSHDSHGH